MPKAKSDHVILNTNKGVSTKEVMNPDYRCRLQFTVCMECLHCGQAFPMPNGLVQWAVDVTRAFATAHKDCRKDA